MNANMLKREAKKALQEHKSAETKAKNALKNIPPLPRVSRIYIRSSQEQMRLYHSLIENAAQLDVYSTALRGAYASQTVTMALVEATKGLEAVMKTMDLEKIGGWMDGFQAKSEDLGLAMDAVRGGTERVQQAEAGAEGGEGMVDRRMDEMVDELGVDLRQSLDETGAVPKGEVEVGVGEAAGAGAERGRNVEGEDFLKKRLRDLRAQ